MTIKIKYLLLVSLLISAHAFGSQIVSCHSNPMNPIQFYVGIYSQGNGSLGGRVIEASQGQQVYQDYQVRETQSKNPNVAALTVYEGASFGLIINRGGPLPNSPNEFASVFNGVFVPGHTSIRSLRLSCHLNVSPSFAESGSEPLMSCCFTGGRAPCTGSATHCK